MPHSDRSTALATAAEAALLLRHFTDTRHIYGDVPNERDALAIHRLLVEVLEASLAQVDLPALARFYERPHFENTADTSKLVILYTALMMWLAESLGLPLEAVEQVRSFHREHASGPIKELERQIQETLAFDCRKPIDRAGPAYASRERAVFLLGQYWDFYLALLVQHGQAHVFFSPHPLLRFIVNAKARIEDCLERIGDRPLSESLREALAIPFDEDTNSVWDEWAQPIVARAAEAYEAARLSVGSGSFALTQAESLFLESGRIQLAALEKRARGEMAKMLQSAERESARRERPDAVEPKTCFEWIRRIEHALREIVIEEARARCGDSWPQDVEATLGPAAADAHTTMKQRHVEELKELVHFTQLADICHVITDHFGRYAPRLGLTKKQFNVLVAPILKGRTEEAHNRPEHLWQDIEKQRVTVACHDLHVAILASQRHQAPE